MSNLEKTTLTVDTKSVDKLARILGTFDENLNFLAKELGILAYVDGVKIRLEGDAYGVSLGAQVLTALVKTSSAEEVDKGKMAYCIELAKEGRTEDILALESGAIAVTARGSARCDGRWNSCCRGNCGARSWRCGRDRGYRRPR